jgi:hypothetical protein
MFNTISKKSAVLSAAALLTSLFTSAPANAETTDNALTRYTAAVVKRTIDPTSKEVKFLAGERISIELFANFETSALTDRITAGKTLVITPGVSVVAGSPLTNTSTYLTMYGSKFSNNLETTFDSTPTSVGISLNFNASATTDVTIKFDPTFTVDSYSFGAADFSFSERSASTGYFAQGSRINAPVIAKAIDSSISFSTPTACIKMDGVSKDDVLEVSYDVNDGLAQAGSKNFNFRTRNAEGMPVGGFGDEESATYTVPDIPAQGSISFEGYFGFSPVVAGKTYTFASYKVVKQGTSANLLTHCSETNATGVPSVTGTTVTGTIDTTADRSGFMSKFDVYSCILYSSTDTNFATPIMNSTAYAMGGGPTSPTCVSRNVPAGTYKMGIRGFSFNGIGSEKILPGTITVGGTPAVVKTNQTFTALPKTAKAGKPVSIAAATKQKVAVKVVVSGKGCKVAAVKDKKKKVVSHKLTMGAKGVTCKVTVTAVTTSKLKAFSYVASIKAN